MIIKNYFRTLLEAEFAAGADFEHDSDLGTSLYEIVSFRFKSYFTILAQVELIIMRFS